MVRTVSCRSVTSVHVGFVVDKTAARNIFIRGIWFCLINIIPSPLRTLSLMLRHRSKLDYTYEGVLITP
jgi:hypothetical protein